MVKRRIRQWLVAVLVGCYVGFVGSGRELYVALAGRVGFGGGLVVKVDGEVLIEDFTTTLGTDGENTRVMRGAGGFFGVARTDAG